MRKETFGHLEKPRCSAHAGEMRYVFADCDLDLGRHELWRNGARVHVEPQVFGLIACLVRASGALVAYDDVMADVWGDRIVSDATVAARVSAARAALGDDGKRQAIIRTVNRRGLQLVADVKALPPGFAEHAARPDLRQTVRLTSSRDGTGIAWASLGEGAPVLRGGHWLGHLEHDLSSPVWRPLLERLSSGRRLIRYDPRGTGLSERCLNGATVEQLADDMEAVADAADLERFPIVAMSQSVPAALTLAARHPARVSGLVLLNGLVQGSTARGEIELTDTMVGMIRTGWGVPGSAFMRALATVFVPDATQAEVDSLVEMQALSATPEVAAEIRAMIGDIDVRHCLAEVACPTLVMHCTGDQVQNCEQSKQIASNIRHAEFGQLDSANHALVPSDPAWAVFLSRVDGFLEGLTLKTANGSPART
ncbi:alpha/beta fold hydrolase [Meridianimarinicoccus aquatilis]|uniref:Alpha/beta fold hydrolase n=1 Tax=Meridianimarinicoccus aquatilis TaxID=2552766 RepID=A0A4R6B5X5_9RHOB|nr:alpha/beta fold hydrolase [Fluviibacterium aquatile]TDL91484.1 alpha/beta fold hydrolase [Fluviibacterium aquatile]